MLKKHRLNLLSQDIPHRVQKNVNFTLSQGPKFDSTLVEKGNTGKREVLKRKKDDYLSTDTISEGDDISQSFSEKKRTSTDEDNELNNKEDVDNSVGVISDVISLNIDDIRKKLDDLVSYSNIHIDNMNNQVSQDFRALLKYMNLLHGTDSYPILLQEIRSRFEKIQLDNIRPGTVGAYFAGCLKIPKNPCSVKCAGSISYDSSQPCLSLVYYVDENGKRNLIYSPTVKENCAGCEEKIVATDIRVYLAEGVDVSTVNVDDLLHYNLSIQFYDENEKVIGTPIQSANKYYASFGSDASSNNIIYAIIAVLIIFIIFLALRNKNK